MPALRYDAFAVTAPGLSPLCAAELRALGMRPTSEDAAGVGFSADPAHLVRANLWLRTASRVLVRLASFKATTFKDLQRLAATVKWADVIQPGQPVTLRVTCRKSKLIHSGAVAQRVGEAIRLATGSAIVKGTAADDDGDEAGDTPPQLIVVRFERDLCTISADSSGALLHRRGYRQAVAKAPIRETLAAGLLLAAGYTGEQPLVDPLCGSGTILIEGALIARRMAPGLNRPFACEAWERVGWSTAAAERGRAKEQMRAAPSSIQGSDRDAGAVAAAIANAERAGVHEEVSVMHQALSAVALPKGGGLLASNPPYGARVGSSGDLRDLYARLGQLLRTRGPQWHLALVSADRQLEHAIGLPLEVRVRTSNGGIPVHFVVGAAPEHGSMAPRDAAEAHAAG
ncbi:MAG: class I SAM-dependent RNA methyltransferase [Gemmatimonadetes bacterium]|nr:class I SAM-dependent RNA methyltransferase [Gemmatimonadota bacterium]